MIQPIQIELSHWELKRLDEILRWKITPEEYAARSELSDDEIAADPSKQDAFWRIALARKYIGLGNDYEDIHLT